MLFCYIRYADEISTTSNMLYLTRHNNVCHGRNCTIFSSKCFTSACRFILETKTVDCPRSLCTDPSYCTLSNDGCCLFFPFSNLAFHSHMARHNVVADGAPSPDLGI